MMGGVVPGSHVPDVLEFHPLTPDRWDDLVALFGERRGGYGGCWCMWWRQTAREYDRDHGEANRRAFQRVVERFPPGVLAYADGVAVGWVQVGPRAQFGRLNRSPMLKPVDDQPVWSINCFVVDRRHRRAGVASALVEAAARFAAERGATQVEAYPRDIGDAHAHANAIYTGTLAMFERAGFAEVARRTPDRPIVRRTLRR